MTNITKIPAGAPPAFAYLLFKAERYLKVGPEVYRNDDFFKMPPSNCSEPLLAVIKRGMEQISRFRGYSRDKPFTDLGIDGFYALLSTLHFEPEKQSVTLLDEDILLDKMHMRHRVTGQKIVLYNAVPMLIIE